MSPLVGQAGTKPRPQPRGDSGDLLDRVILLRNALAGITADNAALRRELNAVRRENRELKARRHTVHR
ncbi:MAG: hypothetical protein J2O48_13175 [Solirubrobacterales bacterium]|nr:hypothetical protein [Solirubrobacterales bacterium]